MDVRKRSLVSIITVVYNSVGSLERTINSVLSQSYSNIEYIIIDGGSTDGTLEIIKRFEHKISHWLSERDSGIYNAMNKGIRLANGELIGILNSDDQYLQDTVENVINRYLFDKPDVIHGDLLKCKEIEGKSYYKPLVPQFSKMEESMGVLHPTCFVKKELYKQYGGFDEIYNLSSDYDFFLRIYKAGCSFSYINKPLAIFTLGGASSNEVKSRWEKYLILRKHRTGNHVKELFRIARGVIVSCFKITMYQFGFSKLINSQLKKKWS